MRKGEIFQRLIISQKEYADLKMAEKRVESAKCYKRIQAMKLIYKKWTYGDIANFLSVTKNTMSNWINLYKASGLSGLLELRYKGKQAKLTKQQLRKIKAEASKGKFTFAKEVKIYIQEQFGIFYDLKHVQLLVKKTSIIL